MIQWLLFAALLVAVLAAILWPLLRRRSAPVNRAEFDIEVYLDQLRELDRDLSRELIDETQAAAARLEIERRLLAAARSADAAPAPHAPGRHRFLAALLAPLISAGALALYLHLGSPGLPDLPFAERPVAPSEGPRIAQVRAHIAAVEDRLADQPDNANLWRDLGSLRLSAGDVAGAVEALARATDLSDGRADIASAYAEALTFAAEGMVTPQAQTLFAKVLEQSPGEPRARFFLALADYQAGRREAALAQWSALAKDAPPGASWLPVVAERIRQTADELGVAAADYLPSPAGPSRDDVAAAQNLAPQQRQEMIGSMVARLAERLEREPNDIEGWRRLGRSYTVLGDPARAHAAYAKALALAPDDRETLLRAGIAAASAQDRAAALGYFEHLRTLIPADSDAYRTVSDAIERLSAQPPAN